jgi:hypothetical protein
MIINLDLINAGFELFGGAFVALNCWDIWKKKAVAGATLTAMGFFTSWGVWNLFYYPSIGQWWSTVGAWGVMLANAIMIGLIVKFREKKR